MFSGAGWIQSLPNRHYYQVNQSKMADGKGSRPFNAANAAGDAAEQRSSKVRRGDYFMCSFSPSDTARQSEKRSRFHEKFAHLINELCKHSPAFVQFDEKLIKKKALLFSRNICYVIDLFQFRSQTANEFLQRLPVFKSTQWSKNAKV